MRSGVKSICVPVYFRMKLLILPISVYVIHVDCNFRMYIFHLCYIGQPNTRETCG